VDVHVRSAGMCLVCQSKVRRRQYTADKHRVLAETDACTRPSQIGARFWRERQYAFGLVSWKPGRDAGEPVGLDVLNELRSGFALRRHALETS